MAQKTIKTVGKGSVVTPAPKSAKGKSTTSKKAGVRTRPTPKRHADLIATARQSAVKAGHKLPYICPALDMALAKADLLADKGVTMVGAGLYAGTGAMPKDKVSAKARREWCAKVRAPKVAIADILHENKDGASLSPRSENTVRQRVITRGMELSGHRYYAVRSEPVTGKVEDQPMVYIVRV